MMPVNTIVPLPTQSQSLDQIPWTAPCSTYPSAIPPVMPGLGMNSLPSMRSTALLWTARLSVILRELLALV